MESSDWVIDSNLKSAFKLRNVKMKSVNIAFVVVVLIHFFCGRFYILAGALK